MDFVLDGAQRQIQKALKDFIKGQCKKEIIKEINEAGIYPEKQLQMVAELGFIGIHFPEKYGGEGLGLFEKTLVAEELCQGDSSVGSCLVRASSGAEMLIHYGSEEQKKTWLPRVAEGAVLGCTAYVETGLSSDLTLSKTTAVEEGDELIINGIKGYVINAGPLAGYYIVLCKTDYIAKPRNGFSAVLVEADRVGIEVKDIGKRLGGRLLHIGEVKFNDVRVPMSNLIGKKNQGYDQVMSCIDETRVLSAAQSLGIAQGSFDRAFVYAKQREQFGQKIVEFQEIQHKLSDMATSIMAARLLTYQAAQSFKNGHGDRKLCAMAKQFAGKIAVRVCDEAIQLFGGYGYVEEYEVERFFRDAKTNDVFDGTQFVQKSAVIDSLLKKQI